LMPREMFLLCTWNLFYLFFLLLWWLCYPAAFFKTTKT
jgi:hypothetical protein